MACRMGLTATALESDEWRQKREGGAFFNTTVTAHHLRLLRWTLMDPPRLSNAVCAFRSSHTLLTLVTTHVEVDLHLCFQFSFCAYNSRSRNLYG